MGASGVGPAQQVARLCEKSSIWRGPRARRENQVEVPCGAARHKTFMRPNWRDEELNPLRRMINGVTDGSIWKRIVWMYVSLFVLLVPMTVLSYVLLPEGILRGVHPLISALELSTNLWVSTLQVFGYNLFFTLLVIGANLIARQSRLSTERFVPLGYLAFWGITATIGLYIGTWSQEIITVAPPLCHRFLRIFDIVHRAALWELTAYLLAATTSFKFTLRYTDGKIEVARRSWREVTLTAAEWILFVLAFVLLLCGAFIESYGIIQLTE